MKLINNSVIEISLDDCTKCKACVNDCVADLFYIESDELHIVEDFEEYCLLCGHCVAICPVDIIRLKIHKTEPTHELPKIEELPSFNSLYNLVLRRRSIRQFKTDPIPKELIEKLLKLARFSPTGSNTENVFYTIIQDKQIVANISNYITLKVTRFVEALENSERRELLKERLPKEEYDREIKNLPRTKAALKTIEKGIDFWCWNGELIFIHGDKTVGGIPENSALAATHIMLAAETLGIGTCSLGYLTFHVNRSNTIKQLIKLPGNHEVGYSLTMGYPNIKYKRVPPRKPLRVQWL